MCVLGIFTFLLTISKIVGMPEANCSNYYLLIEESMFSFDPVSVDAANLKHLDPHIPRQCYLNLLCGPISETNCVETVKAKPKIGKDVILRDPLNPIQPTTVTTNEPITLKSTITPESTIVTSNSTSTSESTKMTTNSSTNGTTTPDSTTVTTNGTTTPESTTVTTNGTTTPELTTVTTNGTTTPESTILTTTNSSTDETTTPESTTLASNVTTTSKSTTITSNATNTPESTTVTTNVSTTNGTTTPESTTLVSNVTTTSKSTTVTSNATNTSESTTLTFDGTTTPETTILPSNGTTTPESTTIIAYSTTTLKPIITTYKITTLQPKVASKDADQESLLPERCNKNFKQHILSNDCGERIDRNYKSTVFYQCDTVPYKECTGPDVDEDKLRNLTRVPEHNEAYKNCQNYLIHTILFDLDGHILYHPLDLLTAKFDDIPCADYKTTCILKFECTNVGEYCIRTYRYEGTHTNQNTTGECFTKRTSMTDAPKVETTTPGINTTTVPTTKYIEITDNIDNVFSAFIRRKPTEDLIILFAFLAIGQLALTILIYVIVMRIKWKRETDRYEVEASSNDTALRQLPPANIF